VVKTNHKNLIYSANITIPKLVHWRVILSEYQFLVHHIPGVQNVVANHQYRTNRCCWMEDTHEMWLWKDMGILRIFRFEGEVNTGMILPMVMLKMRMWTTTVCLHSMKPKYSRFFKSVRILLSVILESTRHWMLCLWQVMSGEVCVTMLRIRFVNVESARR
jgi:hypothetical protein